MEVNNTTAGGATGTGGSANRATLNQTFDSFLSLLTTQLKYQDPISPMDTNEFTSQLVQFSQVEQSIQQNENLETLIALQGANQIAFASSLSGKDIEVAGNAMRLGETGDIAYRYSLPVASATTQINIMNEDGTIVFSTEGRTAAGDYDFNWDGMTADGERAPEGTYRIQVVAKDAAGEAIDTTTSIVANVKGVELSGGEIALDVGGFTVSLGNVMAIREPTEETDAPAA
ncbi:flagellar hook capping FlgD N-terminal domain-containing protein [Inquilinus sp. CAU 1745]|uniref:flagellar hook assembly protein FlgD n=1 Tax=Inquilinus sp. CAU 1745 TaxID=3140369 RepID=UPI00325AAF15